MWAHTKGDTIFRSTKNHNNLPLLALCLIIPCPHTVFLCVVGRKKKQLGRTQELLCSQHLPQTHSSSLLYNSQQKILSLLICSPKALSQQWQLMNYLGHELQIAAGESGISSITSVALKLCSQKLGFQCVLWFSFLSLSPKFPILWLGGREGSSSVGLGDLHPTKPGTQRFPFLTLLINAQAKRCIFSEFRGVSEPQTPLTAAAH